MKTYLLLIISMFFTVSVYAGGGSPVAEPTPPAPAPTPQIVTPGPGLGNIAYGDNQAFQTIFRVDESSGVPERNVLSGGHFGTTTGVMINGYFVVSFAPDSGVNSGGFILYDVSNPADIKHVSTFYDPNGVTEDMRENHSIGVSEFNGRTYLVTQSVTGVEFWDFTDMNNIQRISSMNLPNINNGDYASVAWQTFWQAPYLYVAVADRGIYVVDASDPANPVLADRGAGRPNPIGTSELGGFRVGPIFAMGNTLIISSMEL